MPEAATVTDDTEPMRIALADRVKDAKKTLEEAERAALAAVKPVITNFSGFLNFQKGKQVGPFKIFGENLQHTKPQGGVTLNGHTAQVTGVRADWIKGLVPQDVTAGPVVVKVGSVSFTGKIA